MNKLRHAFIAILTAIGIFCGTAALHNQAYAACAALWTIADENISYCNGASKDGTFSSNLTENPDGKITVTITLNNYQGQMFSLEGYGTGIDVSKYIINLVGSTEITLDSADQRYNDEIDYELTGDGQLIIKSANGIIETLSAASSKKPTPELPTNTNTPADPTIKDMPTEPTEPKDAVNTGSIIVWVGGIILAGILLALWLLHLHSKKSPRKPAKKR